MTGQRQEISPSVDHYLAEFARVERHLPGDLIRERRERLRAFADGGFPHKKIEDWKYTDVSAIEAARFEMATSAADVARGDLADWCPDDLDCHRAVIVDGHFQPHLSELDGLATGIRVRGLATSLADGSAPALGTTVNGHGSAFTDMNAAFAADGLHLRTDAGAVANKPLHVLIVASGRQDRVMAQVRNIMELGDNSQIRVIEHYIGLGDHSYFTNAVTEVHAAPGSRLERIRIQQEHPENGYHVASFHARQQRDSRIINYGIDLGGRLARIDTNSTLDDTGAEIHLYGVYAPTGDQHVDNHTRVDHARPHGTSREAYKGVLSGKSRGVFNGKVIVHKDAQKTDSEQSSDSLLLSKQAVVDAKPELEIYADDVKCAHGSTVGQLDEDAVFYLMSRGLDQDGARAVLTYSFVDEIIGQIEIEPIRLLLERAVLEKLPAGSRFAGLA